MSHNFQIYPRRFSSSTPISDVVLDENGIPFAVKDSPSLSNIIESSQSNSNIFSSHKKNVQTLNYVPIYQKPLSLRWNVSLFYCNLYMYIFGQLLYRHINYFVLNSKYTHSACCGADSKKKKKRTPTDKSNSGSVGKWEAKWESRSGLLKGWDWGQGNLLPASAPTLLCFQTRSFELLLCCQADHGPAAIIFLFEVHSSLPLFCLTFLPPSTIPPISCIAFRFPSNFVSFLFSRLQFLLLPFGHYKVALSLEPRELIRMRKAKGKQNEMSNEV